MKVKSLFTGNAKDIPKLSIKDWTLILIYNGGENKPKDALTIMNEIFIFTQEVLPPIRNEFEFKSTIGCLSSPALIPPTINKICITIKIQAIVFDTPPFTI